MRWMIIAFVGLALLAGCTGSSEPGRTTLLIVKEFDWLNETGAAPVMFASYGGHCAPAHYSESPPTLTLYVSPNETNSVPKGSLVRDFTVGPHPTNTVTTSADAIDFAPVEDRTTLLSPFAPESSRVIATVVRDGDVMNVDGHRLRPNETTTVHVAYDFVWSNATYHAGHVLIFSNLGEARTIFEPRGMCA